MGPELTPKPKWQIDRILDALVGEDVRVAAKAFSPIYWTGQVLPPLMPVCDLFLPDNSQPSVLPVYFEGNLQRFVREIGVVFVCIDSPASPDTAADGLMLFRGKTAALLRGPAVVELASPFLVEKLPSDSLNYWRDLRIPRAQFEFPFLGNWQTTAMLPVSGIGANREHPLTALPGITAIDPIP